VTDIWFQGNSGSSIALRRLFRSSKGALSEVVVIIEIDVAYFVMRLVE